MKFLSHEMYYWLFKYNRQKFVLGNILLIIGIVLQKSCLETIHIILKFGIMENFQRHNLGRGLRN